MSISYGFVIPFADAADVAELAHVAEQAGWDGIFVWEPLWGVDAWVSLTAAAMRTERIRLGTMLTPLPRLRPWKVASEAATLHRLSGGRVILAVGLGAPDAGYQHFDEVTDRRTRAQLLDEGLDIVTQLWAGGPVHHEGTHYRVAFESLPTPVPAGAVRIPIWVVGATNREKSLARALRHDGLLPAVIVPGGQRPPTPGELREVRERVARERGPAARFDLVVEADTETGVEHLPALAQAGATWWLDSMWDAVTSPDAVARARRRLADGPPEFRG